MGFEPMTSCLTNWATAPYITKQRVLLFIYLFFKKKKEK